MTDNSDHYEVGNGPPDLLEKAKQAGFQVIYLAQEAKDQCYLRLVP